MENFNALYYQKPYIREFDATVTACLKTERGYEIELSDTAFYPEGGGQPGDKGNLFVEGKQDRAVYISDTQFVGERIVHIADAELAAGTKVHGVLDWVNRCDNMQGHTGEHILTGILSQTYGYENIGFHMGESFITIDFNGPLTDEQVLDAEQRANEIIRENRPIQESFPNAEERKTMQYRSKIELSGTVRIITIPGLDSCACCGTHVTATGEIGLIKIVNFTNRKKGVRLEVLCGRKAVLAYEQEMAQVRAISRCLSAKPSEVHEAVEKLNAEKGKLQQLLHEMTEKYLKQKAESAANTEGAPLYFEDNLSIEYLRSFCNLLLATGKMHTCAALSAVAVEPEGLQPAAYNYVIVSNAIDLKPHIKTLNQQLNGRGGGSSSAIQGTYFAGKELIEETLTGLLSRARG
ncbi:alanyl-tRNA editing protein [Treponema vincentii]|uniref:Alanine--tRNA ligase n=1 Tax=Treponema vincentii TaxID=69710 RepID=A0A6P1Y3Q1_9SPIR|nr:alanyl-tRNA editing protein [Treponema vincentii]QHX43733.1 alanyl-tRNA editing protein [Treponema vincentii]